jgi:hypothetical protein
MRYLLVLAVLATACTDLPSNGPHYDSVHQRLSDTPTWLYVRDEASIGAIAARRRGGGDSWIAGATTLTIEHGHLRISLDGSGRLAIDQLEIALAPIVLDGVFGKPAELHDVQLRLAARASSDATWTSTDDATASLAMKLAFDWAIVLDGAEPYPLATQQLGPATVDLVLAGNGDRVDAHLALDASGVLWSWADLVQITELALSISAKSN